MAAQVITGNISQCHVYGIVVDGIIRYVGLSHRPHYRLKEHIRDAKRRPGGLIGPKLAKAVKLDSKIEIVILRTCGSRQEAALAERQEIANRGGHTVRGRQLWNTHKGGVGGSSEASSAVLRLRWRNDAAFREKMSSAASRQLALQREDPSFEKRRLASSIAKAKTPEALENLRRARMGVDKEKQKAAVSAYSKMQWQDPEYRSRQIAAIKAAAAKRFASRS